MSYKGRFTPKNPKKYAGDSSNIVYRSLWELKVMKYLDENSNVIYWASEELVIPYVSPVDNRVHRYFPDFVVKTLNKEGKETTLVLEVKPEKQTRPPSQKRKTKQFIQESITYAINEAKWKAAELFCLEHGWKFKIITEKELGI
jgi:hypothetical protein